MWGMCELRGTFYTEPCKKIRNLFPLLFLSQRYRNAQAQAFTRNFPAWASLYGPLLHYYKISHWFQPLWSAGENTLLRVLNSCNLQAAWKGTWSWWRRQILQLKLSHESMDPPWWAEGVGWSVFPSQLEIHVPGEPQLANTGGLLLWLFWEQSQEVGML